ncbi:MAG: hypothetical protein WB626_10925, partial [Bacteroidota bacterium]
MQHPFQTASPLSSHQKPRGSRMANRVRAAFGGATIRALMTMAGMLSLIPPAALFAQGAGWLVLTTDVTCTIVLDGKGLGGLTAGEVKTLPVTPGGHSLRAAANGGMDVWGPIPIAVEAGKKTVVSIQLGPIVEARKGRRTSGTPTRAKNPKPGTGAEEPEPGFTAFSRSVVLDGEAVSVEQTSTGGYTILTSDPIRLIALDARGMKVKSAPLVIVEGSSDALRSYRGDLSGKASPGWRPWQDGGIVVGVVRLRESSSGGRGATSLVRRFDGDSNPVWTQQVGEIQVEASGSEGGGAWGFCFVVTSAQANGGGCIISLACVRKAVHGGSEENEHGAAVWKLTERGSVEWKRDWEPSTPGKSVKGAIPRECPDGNVFVWTIGEGGDQGATLLGVGGQALWNRTYDNSVIGNPQDFGILSDGFLLCSIPPSEADSTWLVRTDRWGNLEWVRKIESAGLEKFRPRRIVVCGNGGCVVAG